MEKPKRGVKPSASGRTDRLFLIFVVVGLLILAILSIGTIWIFSIGSKPALITNPGQILFVGSDNDFGTSSDLYVVNANGTQLTKLTNTPDVKYLHPAWSPDNKHIAFTMFQGGSSESPYGHIYIINADGTGLTRLTKRDLVSENWPTWSPDGKSIAYEEYADTYTIRIASADGSGSKELLPDHLENKQHPVWSPDGKTIAFLDLLHSQELYVVGPDGSNAHRLIEGQVNSDFAWSPDSQQIAFSSNRTSKTAIFTVNVDGSSLKQITPDTSINTSPSWAPDGKQMVFFSNRDGQFKIYVMAIDDPKATPLLNTKLAANSPVWSR